MYGLFKICDKHLSQSNYFFDNLLKMQNDLGGIKILMKLAIRVKKYGFSQESIIKMPAIIFH